MIYYPDEVTSIDPKRDDFNSPKLIAYYLTFYLSLDQNIALIVKVFYHYW